MSFIGAEANQPQNVNFLLANRFRLVLQRNPNVVYFSQQVNFPSVSVASATFNTSILDVPVPGDKVLFDPFNITFAVDEDMKNYKEVFLWLMETGFPASTDFHFTSTQSRSDITLLILDSNHNLSHSITFVDAFPTTLSGMSFDSTQQDTTITQATATFAYAYIRFDEIDPSNTNF